MISTPILVPLASLSQIENTPSQREGIPRELEEDLRALGCRFIHDAGVLLRQYMHAFLFSERVS